MNDMPGGIGCGRMTEDQDTFASVSPSANGPDPLSDSCSSTIRPISWYGKPVERTNEIACSA